MDQTNGIEAYNRPDEKELAPNAEGKPVSIEVKNLIVSSSPKLDLLLGTPDDIVALARTRVDIQAVLWSEEEVSLLLSDRSTEIRFQPELDGMTAEFFTREKKSYYDDDKGTVTAVWEGDYQPVRFTKTNLLKFIARYEADVPDDVKAAIKNLRLKETRNTDSIALDDHEGERIVEEERSVTNLPHHFSLNMPLCHNVRADLEFEAKIVRDNYGKGRPTVELQCINARQVLKDFMQRAIEKFPPAIPRYYGRLNPPKHRE